MRMDGQDGGRTEDISYRDRESNRREGHRIAGRNPRLTHPPSFLSCFSSCSSTPPLLSLLSSFCHHIRASRHGNDGEAK